MSALPGMRFPAGTPLFPSRGEFVRYLSDYRAAFDLPVRTDAGVLQAEFQAGTWSVRTAGGPLSAAALVVATGIMGNPRRPEFPGSARFAGTLSHSVEYRRPGPFAGKRVLVVGVGNSGGEIAPELAANGASVTVCVRSGAFTLPRQLLGIPIQYYSCLLARLPRGAQRAIMRATAQLADLARGKPVLPRPQQDDSPCPDVPLIGFHLADAVRGGAIRVRPAISEITRDGARFADGSEDSFDHIILATGFAATLGFLGGQVTLDQCGFASRRDRVVSTDRPGLYFVGHNYDTRGGLYNIARDAPLAAAFIAAAA
jgi:cation diffusion facilitator CzcD-associated flavoprotein CzcO